MGLSRRARTLRVFRHQHVSLPSQQTWAGCRPVTGKGRPCHFPSGHRTQLQFSTRGTGTQGSSRQIPVIQLWSALIPPTTPLLNCNRTDIHPAKVEPQAPDRGLLTSALLLKHPRHMRKQSPSPGAGHLANAGLGQKTVPAILSFSLSLPQRCCTLGDSGLQLPL